VQPVIRTVRRPGGDLQTFLPEVGQPLGEERFTTDQVPLPKPYEIFNRAQPGRSREV
jgi:hypothetical protein